MASNHLILVINCGSSSLKFALVDTQQDTKRIAGLAERLGTAEASLNWVYRDEKQQKLLTAENTDHKAAMQAITALLRETGLLVQPPAAIGHRVVHGGEAFTASTLIDNDVLTAVERCNHLAPLHNPANVLGIRTARQIFPDVPQVAVFDTAFHQTLPPAAYLYPVPYPLYLEHGVRRYGFHGTSHRYVAQKAAAILRQPATAVNLITAHLGNGCSATAVRAGQSVDTTMGLTPLEGLMMGTRSGNVDPALHKFLHDTLGYSMERINTVLNKESGLLGVSGLSNDMRTLVEAADEGHEQAALAIELFCYRLAKALAGLAVPLGHVDALVFTGGIGENAAHVRARTLQHLSLLGYQVDGTLNHQHGRTAYGRITLENSSLALVIPTDEERMIAQDSIDLIQA